jgi:hypothetical protein
VEEGILFVLVVRSYRRLCMSSRLIDDQLAVKYYQIISETWMNLKWLAWGRVIG